MRRRARHLPGANSWPGPCFPAARSPSFHRHDSCCQLAGMIPAPSHPSCSLPIPVGELEPSLSPHISAGFAGFRALISLGQDLNSGGSKGQGRDTNEGGEAVCEHRRV